MSDNIQHIDVDSDEYLDTPKALRDHVKRLQARLSERDEEVGSLRGQLTATALNDVLGGFKNPERVKRDLLSDKIDPLDREAVDKWLTQNADDYARAGGSPTPSDAPDAEEREAHQRLAATGSLKSPADMTAAEAAFSEITPDMTGQDLIKLFQQKGL